MVKVTDLEDAREFADEIISAFARLYPGVKLTWNEWSDLREMIERQWVGDGMQAADLVDDPLYLAHRRG